MKKLYIILIAAFFFQLNSFSQTALTNGDIFDFEVGDVFQYRIEFGEGEPRGEMKTLISKSYSENLDTVFYTFSVLYYELVVDWSTEPPTSDYVFTNSQVAEYYTQLDSVFSKYNQEYEITYSEALCTDSLINFHTETPYDEPEIYNYKYGQGMGRVRYDYSYSAEYEYYEIKLVYYNKQEDICGSIDNTYDEHFVGIDEVNQQSQFSIFPNPVSNTLNITGVETESKLEILNLQGQVLKQQIINSDQSIDLQSFPTGIYLVKINHQVIKFIKE